MKATFGSGTDDAVLEMPLSVTSKMKSVTISYEITSPRIQLSVLQRKAGNTEFDDVGTDIGPHTFGGWNSHSVSLDSDVEAIQLVARKTGVTTNVVYVIVASVKMEVIDSTGN